MDFLSTEQLFAHRQAVLSAKNLTKEELEAKLSEVVKLFMVYQGAFKALTKWCFLKGHVPPPLDQLLGSTEVRRSSDTE